MQYIHKTAEMGCEGILSVLNYTADGGLKNVLSQQLDEYRNFERDAEKLLLEHGERANDVGTVAKTSARMMSAGKLAANRSASKIAEMTIEGNNMGINKDTTAFARLYGKRTIGDRACQSLSVNTAGKCSAVAGFFINWRLRIFHKSPRLRAFMKYKICK